MVRTTIHLDRAIVMGILAGGFCATAAAPVSAGITPVGAGSFSGSATVITFDEVAVGTTIPFTIGLADFVGLSGFVHDAPMPVGFGLPPAPSGLPYLYTGSVGDQDVIEIEFGAAMESVGAYFDVTDSVTSGGTLQMEFYNGATLLGIVAAIPDAGTFGGFVGGSAGSAVIDRIIFRDIDFSLPVSFRLDDVMFQVPGPGALALFVVAAMVGGRRRY